MKKIIQTSRVPQAVGPYSQAVESDGLLFVSGQLGMDPEKGEMKEGIREQTRQTLDNLKMILMAAGYSLQDVVKCTVYLEDMEYFGEMNEEYARYFPEDPPARAAFQVAALPLGALVEVEAIASKK